MKNYIKVVDDQGDTICYLREGTDLSIGEIITFYATDDYPVTEKWEIQAINDTEIVAKLVDSQQEICIIHHIKTTRQA